MIEEGQGDATFLWLNILYLSFVSLMPFSSALAGQYSGMLFSQIVYSTNMTLLAIGGLLIMGPRMGGRAEHHGVMLGAASGVLFGVSDTAIKALTGISGAHGLLALALSPWLLVALSASVVAFYASARGLQDGQAVPVIAVTGTAANISGIAGGILVFGDPMAGSPLGVTLQALAFVLVVVAAALMPAPLRAAGSAAAA